MPTDYATKHHNLSRSYSRLRRTCREVIGTARRHDDDAALVPAYVLRDLMCGEWGRDQTTWTRSAARSPRPAHASPRPKRGRAVVRGLPWLFGAEDKAMLLRALLVDPPGGGWTIVALGARIGVHPKTVRGHLTRLEQIGLVPHGNVAGSRSRLIPPTGP